MKRLWRLVLVIVLAAAAPAHADDGPVIAAASDLKFALDEIVVEFQESTGKPVRVSYGSSGNFFTQLMNEAPFPCLHTQGNIGNRRQAAEGLLQVLDTKRFHNLFVPGTTPSGMNTTMNTKTKPSSMFQRSM